MCENILLQFLKYSDLQIYPFFPLSLIILIRKKVFYNNVDSDAKKEGEDSVVN